MLLNEINGGMIYYYGECIISYIPVRLVTDPRTNSSTRSFRRKKQEKDFADAREEAGPGQGGMHHGHSIFVFIVRDHNNQIGTPFLLHKVPK